MSMMLLGWCLIAASIVILALGVLSLLMRYAPGRLLTLKRIPARFSISPTGASAVIVPAAVFLVVAGLGSATSKLGILPGFASADASPDAMSDAAVLNNLASFTQSLGDSKPPPPASASANALPDVNSMIERLASRLEAAPNDVDGWRMLGWSYFNTDHYGEAAAAYAKALALDPNSAEIKRLYTEANAKAAGSVAMPSANASVETAAMPNASASAPTGTPNDQIKAMVDGLAARLDASPRDVDGWTRLMRSRVVLGETDVAAAAFRKALDVFKDDSAASGVITSAGIELGLAPN